MNLAKFWDTKSKQMKSLSFLYTNNEKSEREIKESIPFPIAIKTIKYLGINLKNCTQKMMTLMNKIKDDIHR